MNEECCGSREEGQANDIPAALVAVYDNMYEKIHQNTKGLPLT